MTMKRYVTLGLASVACHASLSAVRAADLPEVPTNEVVEVYQPRTELLLIGNIADNDSEFAMGSVRYSVTGYVDSGFKVRLDASRSTFDFDVGGVATEGEDLRVRGLGGYSMLTGITKFTVYAGLAYRNRDISPSTPFVDEGDDVGFFGSGEVNMDFRYGANLQVLGEFESIADTFYLSGYYVHPFGPARIGPTVNFLTEDDYERIAGGVRVNVPMGRHFELTGTGALARGGNDAFDDESSYVELQLRSEF